MLPLNHKHALITAALLATLSIAACGAKKEVGGAPPIAQTETPTTTSIPTDETQTDDTSGAGNGTGLGEPSAEGEVDYTAPEYEEETPSYTEDNESYPDAPPTVEGEPEKKPRKYLPPIADVQPAPTGGATLPSDYVTSDVKNADREGLEKRLTGGVTPEGLLYTSTATDNLLNFIRARNEKVSQETRRANIAAAASVVSSKISVNSGKATITLKIQEGRDVKVYNVKGDLRSGPATLLSAVHHGNNELTTGGRALTGTLKCVDFDGGCENMFARFTIGTSPNSSVINVIFRNSPMDLYFHLPGKYSNNPEYYVMRELAINTIQRLDSENRLKSAGMRSWEVVNGRSGVALIMKARNNELLAFAGPLLAPERGTGVNIELSRLAQDQEDTLDLISRNNSQLTYANWIADARMILNNGLGQVRVELTMRPRASFYQDTFAITFMRRLKPVVELTDANLK